MVSVAVKRPGEKSQPFGYMWTSNNNNNNNNNNNDDARKGV
jgi:hypothetical protein